MPNWFADAIGRSESNVTITDIVLSTTALDETVVRLTLDFAKSYREPKRYYSLVQGENGWECRTPREPSICSTVVDWLEYNTTGSESL